MWWKTGVIYQIYPRSFMDSNGDGIGDLAGVLSRLDYVQSLGIDVIWFSPIFPSPMRDFGYDVADYVDIHADYGTLEIFDKLLVEAHSRNIKVILDLVPNHTSIDHAWFQESRSSRDNPKRDWYIWRDPKPDGSEPNNWLSYFGGPAWTFDPHTEQYYMHNFETGQPELNWRNPEVEQAIFDSIRFWLRRGLDGFRIDVVDRLLKDDQFRDNPTTKIERELGGAQFAQERLYSEGAPGTHDLMKRLRAVFDEFPSVVSVGEVSFALTPDELASFYGKQVDEHTGDEIHLPFNFGLLDKKWDAQVFRDYINQYDAALPSYAWPNYVLGNHDVPRINGRYGKEIARTAGLLLLTLRGTPTLYYGDEIDMVNTPIPEDRMLDPQGINKAGFNRDECRTPMQWDASHQAGFSTADETWLPVAPDYVTNNVESQSADPDSTLNFYRRALAYRRASPVLQSGRYYSVETSADDKVFTFWRRYNDQECLVLLNFSSDTIDVNLSSPVQGKVALSTHRNHEGTMIDGARVTLAPHEGIVIEVTNA